MNELEIIEKLEEIFEDIFDEEIKISRELTADDIEDWDSLNHINIIVAIESEFGIKFSLDELQLQKTVGDTIDLIIKKI